MWTSRIPCVEAAQNTNLGGFSLDPVGLRWDTSAFHTYFTPPNKETKGEKSPLTDVILISSTKTIELGSTLDQTAGW